MPIYFYTSDGEYGCFSSFSLHPFTLDGFLWRTAEHYFQAQKFSGTPYEASIRQALTPKQAFILGNSRKYKIRPDWEEVKDKVMFKAVLEKFKTHASIREILLNTNNEQIIETSDPYWGCGSDGHGRNQLGIILMEIRDILRKKED
jgi:ribA/ribD-fused uncharacterized protein